MSEEIAGTVSEATKLDSVKEDKLSLSNFARELPKLIESEHHNYIRCAEKGLFIAEEKLELVLAAYSTWFHQVTGITKDLSHDKLVRKLFDTDHPELSYLLDGKICLVGYLVPGENLSSFRIAIPACVGSVMSTRETLHHKDPLFASIPGVKCGLGQGGFQVEIEVGSKKILVSNQIIEQFNEIVKRNRSMQRMFPARRFSKRGAIAVLVRCIRKARKVRNNRSLIIPSRFRQNNNIEIVSVAGIVFVLEGGKVLDCYGLFSGPLVHFLDMELNDLFSTLKKKRQGPFEIARGRNNRIEIRYFSKDERFGFDVRAIIPMLSDCHQDRSTEPKHFTLFDLIRGAARVFEHSGWVAPHAVPKNLSDLTKEYQKVRSAHNWYFFIDRNNVVRISLRVRSEKPITIISK